MKIKSIIETLRDIFYRVLGKQKCVLFSKDYIDIDVIKQYKEIFDNNYMFSKTDENGLVTFANKKFLDTHNVSIEDIIGKSHNVVKCKITSNETFKEMWDTLKEGNSWSSLMSYTTVDGELGYNSVSIFPIFNDKNKICEFIALRNDISKIINLEEEIEEAQREMIVTLGAVIEGKDGELKEHIERVSEYSFILAKAYGLDIKDCNNIKLASPLHDAGKIGIPDGILNAPRKLTDEEFEVIKTHPEIGYNLFKDSNLPLLKVSSSISREHHEKWDGTGYPRGLKGEEISICGRITALADVFDALSIDRVYKEAWPLEKIEDLLLKEKGKHFEPKLVDLYFENKDKFQEVMEKNRK